MNMMRILLHSAGLGLFICLFLLGSFIVRRSGRIAKALTASPNKGERLCKFFQYGGRTFKVVASIGGFLESVSLVILSSGVLIDAIMGM